jgi:hypothetical protein
LVQYSGLRDGITRCRNLPLFQVGKVKGLPVDPTHLTANRGNPEPLGEYFIKDFHLFPKVDAKGNAHMSVTHFPAEENEFLETVHPHGKLGIDGGGYPHYLAVFSILIDIDHIAPNIRTVHPFTAFLHDTDGTIHPPTPPEDITHSYKMPFMLTP